MADTHIVGWKLDRGERAQLLARFPPHWPDVIADHVTLARVPRGVPLPGPVQAEIVGSVDDGEGLQALVVRLDGTTSRPDGSTYHITWSLDRARGREARQSNDVLKALRWVEWPEAVPISVTPTSWDWPGTRIKVCARAFDIRREMRPEPIMASLESDTPTTGNRPHQRA